MQNLSRTLLLSGLCGLLVLTGCASKGFVRREVSAAEAVNTERLARLEDRLADNSDQTSQYQGRLAMHDDELAGHAQQLGELSATAREALERATEAGKLAEGKLLYETTFSSNNVRFDFDRAELSGEMHAALDDFATSLRAQNANVFIEIQGHTDAVGSEDYNLRLGEARAEAVLRYLSMRHGIPPHRMSKISYGEAAPRADNDNRTARAENRRVVLVVLA